VNQANNTVSADYWKLSKAYYSILKCYVDSLSEKDLVEYAIQGMLKELDPHSVHISKEEVERANESIVGNFDGIGISTVWLEPLLNITILAPVGTVTV
jgi:carboxyl-terminal processing protease